jgi:hypothetical protein
MGGAGVSPSGAGRKPAPLGKDSAMMPKGRIYKEKNGWSLTVSFLPHRQKLEVFSDLPDFQSAVRASEIYRWSFLNVMAKQSAPQNGLVH